MAIIKYKDKDGEWKELTVLKGDKGDPLVYDDLTDGQKQELIAPIYPSLEKYVDTAIANAITNTLNNIY